MKKIIAAALTMTAVFFVSHSNADAYTPPCSRIIHIGDSVTLHSRDFQMNEYKKMGHSNAVISAAGSRTIFNKMPSDKHTGMQAVDYWKKRSDENSCWIIALGTNDSGFYKNEDLSVRISSVMKKLGDRRVAWVSVWKAPSGKNSKSAKIWNSSLVKVSSRYPNMQIIEWHKLVSQNRHLTNPDGVHYGPTGSKVRAKFIARWISNNWAVA